MNERARESIQEFFQQWFRAMEQADAEGLVALLDEEFYLKGPGQPAVTDKNTLREFLEQFHQTYTETFEWEIDDLRVFESHAVVRLLEEVTLVSKQTGDTTKIEGVHMALLHKDDSSRWKMHTDVSSLNHPAPES